MGVPRKDIVLVIRATPLHGKRTRRFAAKGTQICRAFQAATRAERIPRCVIRVRGGVVALVCVVLVVLLTGVWLVAHRASVRGEQRTQALRAGWRAQNQQALLAMSAVGRLPVYQQAQLDRAGDDPERMRQVMIEIHEERLATASKDLEDAQQRKVELEGGGGYKVFADQSQPKDLVELANDDEWAATSAIGRYAEALRRIRAWQPESFAAFTANGGNAIMPAVPQQPSVVAAKPDPRVPLNTASARVQRAVVPMPAQAAVVANNVAHESVAPVPATPGVLPEPVVPAPKAGAGSLTDQQWAEAEINASLQRWAQAMTQNDPEAETAAYAPHMDRYFLHTNVDRAFVQADKAAYLRRGNRTSDFQLRNVQIEDETDTTADVRLVKDVTWGQSSSGQTHKLIRSELWLVRTADGWKIAGERDFR